MDARFSYREAAVRGASPIQLVVYLYEQAIEDLRRAILALEKGDIEARTRAINHALMIIAQLQGTIDDERGGEVAANLHRFYNLVRAGLVTAQFKQSAETLEQQMTQLSTVHEAWLQVELATSPAPITTQTAPIRTSEPEDSSTIDWNA